MGRLDNYRSSLDYREILRILQKASALQDNFLWQSHSTGKNVVPIHHFEIDFVTREVVVYFDSNQFQVASDLPLYVKLDYRTSVFKIPEFRQMSNAVHFSFPKEVKTLELRTFQRHTFLPNHDKIVALKPSITGNRDPGNELKVRVFDISQFGMGLIVSESNRSYLKNNRILWVTRFADYELPFPILSEVVYINSEVDSRYQVKKMKELKVGLKLSGAFPEDLFQQFIS